MASTDTAVHEPAVVFTSPDVFAPAPYSAAAATANAVAFEIQLHTAARIRSDAACTDTRAFGTHSAHVELAAPCITTPHDISMPGSHSPQHPSTPLPPMPPPAKRGMGSCLRLAPPPDDGLFTARGARALWSGHSNGGGGNGHRTGSAQRGKGGRIPEGNRAATTRQDSQDSPLRAHPRTRRSEDDIVSSPSDVKVVQPHTASPVSGRCSHRYREVMSFLENF